MKKLLSSKHKHLIFMLPNTFYIFVAAFFSFISYSCSEKSQKSDAYGNFEAVETTVSSEASGKLIEFELNEGEYIESGKKIGLIETSQTELKIKQLEYQKNVISSKFKTIDLQAGVLEEQKKNSLREKIRIEKLLLDNAATGKQLDDINGNINVLDKQILQIKTQILSTKEEIKTIEAQIAQLRDQLEKSSVVNPVSGTVTLKLAEQSEIVVYGKPLYRIADLSNLDLKVFISGEQLSSVVLGQKVKVLIDKGKDSYKEYIGTVFWISPKAEFTPKIIQTKEERVNLVYAVKVRVENDGLLKIGMPGEVIFE